MDIPGFTAVAGLAPAAHRYRSRNSQFAASDITAQQFEAVDEIGEEDSDTEDMSAEEEAEDTEADSEEIEG